MKLSHSADTLLKVLSAHQESWERTIAKADGPRVLLATSMANYNHASAVERSLAVALTLRRARVEFLLCDSVLPACQMTKIQGCSPEELLSRPDTPRCSGCMEDAENLFDPLGLKVHRFSQYLPEQEGEVSAVAAAGNSLEAIREMRVNDVAVGEHAVAGALRYFGRGDLDGESHGSAILERYLLSCIKTEMAVSDLLRRNKFDVAVFHHGIYTPQGIIGEVCRRDGVRVVNWNPSYRRNTFIFSHNDSYHHTMITEPVSLWKDLSWTQEVEQVIDDYLRSRRDGSSDWIWFHEHPENDADAVAVEFGIDWSRPVIALLTSVVWDAQLHYRANAFPNMLAWIEHTIDYFRRRPDLQLLIRVHPAEVRGMVPSRQKVADELVRRVPDLPPNVFVIPPEHQASTYALADRCNAALIYNTKTGIELSAAGIPVIVAGEAWIRGKGFSLDAGSPIEYDALLDKLPLTAKLDHRRHLAARKYAFHFFFRRMIEFPFIGSPKQFTFSLEVDDLHALDRGKWPGLDLVCDGILMSSPFVYEYEKDVRS